MRVPLRWLRELVEVPLPVPQLAERLTMAGLEVEAVHQVGAGWHDVAVARVVDLERHPRADTLFVARLDRGDGAATVVTAAPNLRVGALVPHVAPGGRIAAGEIGARAFQGITSEGMLLSGDELGIAPDRDGIYLLEDEAPVGASLAEVLGDTVLDIYVTPNRPDCMSVQGIAREVHALTGGAFRPVSADPPRGATPAETLVSVRVEDPVGCPRFTATVVQGVQPGPSPRWVQRRLHLAGVRAISSVVDVTNYVMLELGQPLHAFDRARLQGGIVVRRAQPGEQLRTLDGEQRTLQPAMLVVADERGARSLAGIMGGQDSEIAADTREVVLEAASWDRATIRTTAGALNLWSEASRRFGRGVDPELTALALARATALTLAWAGGQPADGLVDVYPGRSTPPTIVVRPEQVNALLGTAYTEQQMQQTWQALGFGVERGPAPPARAGAETSPVLSTTAEASSQALAASPPPLDLGLVQQSGSAPTGAGRVPASSPSSPEPASDPLTAGRAAFAVSVPSHRRFDVEHRADLAEEVGRVVGYESVPVRQLRGALPAPRPDGDGGYADELRARRALAAAGLQEVISYALVDPAQLAKLDAAAAWPVADGQVANGLLRIQNPQSPEQSALRGTLLGSLLETLRANLRQRQRVLLFELARTWRGPLDPLPTERRSVGIALAGPREQPHWHTATDPLDVFDLKGVVDALCRAFGVVPAYASAEHPSLHPGRSALVLAHTAPLPAAGALLRGGTVPRSGQAAGPGATFEDPAQAAGGAGRQLGVLGQLHPRVARRFDLDDSLAPVLLAELDFEALLAERRALEQASTPSRFPPAERDISLTIAEARTHAEVEAAIWQAGGPLLAAVRLFDVYHGAQVPAGRKGLAYALSYRAPDRTLSDEEVAGVHARVEQHLASALGAEIRGR